MDRLSLQAQERTILGKKVKKLRKDGFIPGHVFGRGLATEHVSVKLVEFLPILHQAGETGLIDLKVGKEQIRPVLIRDVQYDPIKGTPLNIDFYQVNLKEKVTVSVPIRLIGEEPGLVHMGEAVVLQTLNEVEVEALPTDLVEHLEVDISTLQQIDDAITVAQLSFDRDRLTVLADLEETVVKLAPAVTEEMKQLLEEQEAEAVAAQEAAVSEEGEEVKAEEGVEAVEGEQVPTEEAGEDETVPAKIEGQEKKE